ncbi:MAG: CYCYC family (seleno)protein, partial [Gemmatimonadota bacterium]
AARRIPQILDGIRCHCGCATLPGFYSLLSCYEGDGMARMCVICQGQARLADRLERAGKSLDQIRSAIDARFG